MTSKATAVCVYVEQQITSSMAWVRIIFSLLHHNIILPTLSRLFQVLHRNKASRKLSNKKAKINFININQNVSVFSFVTCSQADWKFLRFFCETCFSSVLIKIISESLQHKHKHSPHEIVHQQHQHQHQQQRQGCNRKRRFKGYGRGKRATRKRQRLEFHRAMTEGRKLCSNKAHEL